MTLDWRDSREEYRWLGAICALTAVTFAIAYVAGNAAGLVTLRAIWLYMKAIFWFGPMVLFFAAIPLVIAALVMRVPNPLGRIAAFFKAHYGSPALAAAAIAPILIVPVMMGAFGILKMIMPLSRAFTWDDWLANADKMLFLGYQPWQFTHALFGGAWATNFIDVSYTLWVASVFGAVLYFALAAPRHERAQFFLSFTASWLLIGVLGAYAFASAGPCYTAAIGAASAIDFQPLMAKLKAMHEGGTFLAAYDWQGVLWDHHVNRKYAFAMGISAMPSMHNAITLLYALALRRAPRPVRLLGWAFVALIFIGSIHLGWHYAVDGIAAGLMMWGIWLAAGAYLDRVGYTEALRRRRAGQAAEPDAPDLAPEPVAI